MKELVIEIRPSAISLQGAAIGDNPDAAKELLQKALDALDALEKNPTETHPNEIVVGKKKEK